jgi:hypothetical protein
MKQIFFYNNTDVPIMMDYWIDETWVENICCSNSIKIEPKENRKIYSCLGEWNLHSEFHNLDDTNLWKNKGLDILNPIGNIRYKPNSQEKFTFINYDVFCLEYKELYQEENNYGIFTFSYKKMKID